MQGRAEQSRAEQVREGHGTAGHDMAGQGTPVGEAGYRANQAYSAGSGAGKFETGRRAWQSQTRWQMTYFSALFHLFLISFQSE